METLLQNTAATTSSTRGLSRKNRVHVFRQFLSETYGDWWKRRNGDSNSPFVVLDGAGGKGDLSWLLTNVDGLDSVIIADPRVAKSNHLERSVAYLRQHPDVAQERAVPHVPTHQPLAALLPQIPDLMKRPRHMRILVDDLLVAAVRRYQETKCMKEWKMYWERALERGLEANTLGYKEEEDVASVTSMQSMQIVDAEYALHQVLLKLCLVVGFHPDQATEALVDLACVLRIPFAVVPCCVFPSEFPHRHLPNDRGKDSGTTGQCRRVRTHSEFMEYLKRKVPHAREARLDFVFTDTAKNQVLYTMPTDGQ